MPREEIDGFLKSIPPEFADPLTKLSPTSERELSSVLAVKHQLKELNWKAVRFRDRKSADVDASSVIEADDHVLCEYPLFANNSRPAIDRWGLMAPDLLFFSPDMKRVTLVECKLDSPFTHDNRPPNGQLSRYLAFLSHLKGKRNLVLLFPRCNLDWYAKRLWDAVNESGSAEVQSYFGLWEDIYPAIVR
jgi:hypothetical protein